MANLNSLALRGAHLVVIALASTAFVANAASQSCDSAELDHAEAAFGGIVSWHQLALAHQRFSHCDVGYVAEGNSEAIVRLLVDHWASVSELNAVATNRPAFLRFILRHLDTTVNDADLERIVQLATTQCPAAKRPLCVKLIRAAQQAIAES